MPPSKNKQEERQRKYLEEVAIAKATTSDNPSSELDRLRSLQRQAGSAHIPLSGGGAKRGGGDWEAGGLTPMLGGGLTPLTGNRKVEAMLGISKPGGGGGGRGKAGKGGGGMPPPAPRR